MTISIIVAIGRNRAIGAGGDLAFHIGADLRHFKAATIGKPLIMGRKTFESLPGGALPGRRNIVITSNPEFSAPDIETAASLEQALGMAEGAEEVMIIGGAQVYAQALPLASRLIITEIDAECPGADTFFPPFDPAQWLTGGKSEWQTDTRTSLPYRFICLTRK